MVLWEGNALTDPSPSQPKQKDSKEEEEKKSHLQSLWKSNENFAVLEKYIKKKMHEGIKSSTVKKKNKIKAQIYPNKKNSCFTKNTNKYKKNDRNPLKE